jgi:hypothetical protein
MSFETIRIQRSQPIIDKKYIKIPGKENFESPPVEYNFALDSIDNVDAVSIATRNGIIPNYQKNLNLDFITYAEVGLDGKMIGSDTVVDFQQELRDVSDSLNFGVLYSNWWRNELIDLGAVAPLVSVRGTPSEFDLAYGDKTLVGMDLNFATSGYIQDISSLSNFRSSKAVVCVGDSMTRGAGSPLREIDFGAIVGSILPNNPLVYNLGSGGDTTSGMLSRLQSRPELYDNNFYFWGGHNNPNPTNDVANIRSMISLIGHDRYVVIGTTTQDAVNDALEDAFGDHYVDPRPSLISYDREGWPSLRIDSIHLSEEGSLVVANAVKSKGMEWFDLSGESELGLSRSSLTFIILAKPDGWDGAPGPTNADYFRTDPTSYSASFSSLQDVMQGYKSDGSGIIRTAYDGGHVILEDGVWAVGVIRSFSCSMDIKDSRFLKTANPVVNEGFLARAVTTMQYGARGAPNFDRQGPEAKMAMLYVPRALTYLEVKQLFSSNLQISEI